MQIGVIAQTASGSKWIVEVKWRSRRVGKKEMQRLLAHAKAEAAQGWFISRAGFTDEAVEFARQEGLFSSDGQTIHQLHLALKI